MLYSPHPPPAPGMARTFPGQRIFDHRIQRRGRTIDSIFPRHYTIQIFFNRSGLPIEFKLLLTPRSPKSPALLQPSPPENASLNASTSGLKVFAAFSPRRCKRAPPTGNGFRQFVTTSETRRHDADPD